MFPNPGYVSQASTKRAELRQTGNGPRKRLSRAQWRGSRSVGRMCREYPGVRVNAVVAHPSRARVPGKAVLRSNLRHGNTRVPTQQDSSWGSHPGSRRFCAPPNDHTRQEIARTAELAWEGCSEPDGLSPPKYDSHSRTVQQAYSSKYWTFSVFSLILCMVDRQSLAQGGERGGVDLTSA